MVGVPITATLFLTNRASHPADDVMLTLPLPDGARPLADGTPAPSPRGWSWTLGRLAGGATTVVTASLRLLRMPTGEALLLTPTATARGLAEPVQGAGGTFIDERVPPGQQVLADPDAAVAAAPVPQPAAVVASYLAWTRPT
jgi:hypothetical protein